MSLTFDDATHTYRWSGRVVPSVTQIIRRLHALGMVDEATLAAASERGTFVHQACHYHDEGDLQWDTVAAQERPYVEAWVKFCGDHKPQWVAIEKPIYHKLLCFAGTPDRFCFLDWRGGRVLAQADIKTAVQAHPVWGLQTAAYNAAADRPGALRLSVQLAADGRYRIREWPDPSDWPTFVSLINLDNWKRKHNL